MRGRKKTQTHIHGHIHGHTYSYFENGRRKKVKFKGEKYKRILACAIMRLGGYASRFDDACPFLFSLAVYPSRKRVSLGSTIQFYRDITRTGSVRPPIVHLLNLIEGERKKNSSKTSKAKFSIERFNGHT